MLKINTQKFDPANWPEGTWIAYTEGVRFKVRKLTAEALREIRKPHVRLEMELNPVTRRMEQVEKLDAEKFDDALTDYLLEDFEGIGDENGNVLAANLANKKAILNMPVLRDFIWAAAQAIEVAGDQRTEQAVKN